MDRTDPRAYFEELRHQLVGRFASDRQLAGNSLSIWIDAHEGKGSAWTIWLEPTWHLRDSEKVLAGSRQAQDETDPSGWEAVKNSIDALVGRTLEALDIDPTTGDLIAQFSGVVARTFLADPRDDFLSEIHDLATGTSLVGSPRGLRLVRKGTEWACPRPHASHPCPRPHPCPGPLSDLPPRLPPCDFCHSAPVTAAPTYV